MKIGDVCDKEKIEKFLSEILLFTYEEQESDGNYEGAGVHSIEIPVYMKDFLHKNLEFIKHLSQAISNLEVKLTLDEKKILEEVFPNFFNTIILPCLGEPDVPVQVIFKKDIPALVDLLKSKVEEIIKKE